MKQGTREDGMGHEAEGKHREKISLRTITSPVALAVIVSNMIGTGVFTSLGFQVGDTRTGFALLALWVVGGVVALCGALSYAELGAAMPRSGGEYVYLTRAYHPVVGFLGGWVSMTVGFSAPIALAAIAFGRYVSSVIPVNPVAASFGCLGLVAAVHAADLRLARRFQLALTGLELLLIAGFIVAGLPRGTEPIVLAPTRLALAEMTTPAFAVSLIYVSYAFSGWNAAGYIAGEIRHPERVIPRMLVAGTVLVTVLYVLLNWTFLRTVPLEGLEGVLEVGALSAGAIFGARGGTLMSAAIAVLLVATISAMVLAGSRVTQAVAAGVPGLGPLGRRTVLGVPRNAVYLQAGLTAVLLLSNSFEQVMAYAGFTLNLSTLLTVTGLLVLRAREPGLARPYRVWAYPLPPVIFIALSAWTLWFVLRERPLESLSGLATLAVGLVFWYGARRVRPQY